MGKTIIQTIGPLYGEPNNGTVFGRPNGSVYVPSSNTVSITLAEDYRYICKATPNYWRACDSSGTTRNGSANNPNYVAEAQDLSSYVQFQVYSDEALTTLVAVRSLNAGMFNGYAMGIQSTDSVVNGATYYLRAQLMNNGVAVATSNVIPIVGVSE